MEQRGESAVVLSETAEAERVMAAAQSHNRDAYLLASHAAATLEEECDTVDVDVDDEQGADEVDQEVCDIYCFFLN